MPWFQFRGGRTGNAGQYQTDRGPFTNKNVTHDVVANLTKVAGSHALKAGLLLPEHVQAAEHLRAASTARINFHDDANNPFDTGYGYANAATGVFNTYTQASKFAIPEWRYHNVEFYVQDNWKAGNKLTLDYGVRFYYLTPQWDETLQASNFLPERVRPQQRGSPLRAGLHRRLRRAAAPTAAAWIRALAGTGVTPTLANTVEDRFIGRLTPDSDRFNGSFQAGQGITDSSRTAARSRSRRASAWSTT